MNKKVVACLVAIAEWLAILPISVHAESTAQKSLISREYLYEGQYGEAFVNTYGSLFLVLTDGASGNAVLGASSEKNNVFVYGEISEEQLHMMGTVDPALREFLASNDADVRAFAMGVPSECKDEEDTLFRKLSLESSSVVYVAKMSETSRPSLYWLGDVSIQVTDHVLQQMQDGDRLETLYPDLLGENSQFMTGLNKYGDWYSRYQGWASAADVSTMSAEEVAVSRSESGLETDYEVLYYVFDLCEILAESRTDIFVNIVPKVSARCQITSDFRTSSPWENVGDLDGDGTLSAADASQILIASANNGAGDNAGLSTDALQLADINADGVFDAADAALVLMYAAYAGSGGELRLEEYLS